MTNTNETVREVCAEYTKPNHTCRRCEFAACPEIDVLAGKVLAAYEREMAAKDAEITRLKAALKPVMECDLTDVDASLNCILMSSHNAVREAQRIVKEGGVA